MSQELTNSSTSNATPSGWMYMTWEILKENNLCACRKFYFSDLTGNASNGVAYFKQFRKAECCKGG